MKLNKRLFLHPVNSSKNLNEKVIMKNFFFYTPEEYFKFIQDSDGLYFRLDNEVDLEVWNPERCVDTYKNYLFKTYLSDAVPIGGDGGDLVILYFRPKVNDHKIYATWLGDLDEDSLVLLADNLTDFLSNGRGLNVFLDF